MAAFLRIFWAIFTAEFGDKAQIATVLFAATDGVVVTFLGSASAFVATALLACIAGPILKHFLEGKERYMEIGSGTVFVIIGIWTIVSAIRGGK